MGEMGRYPMDSGSTVASADSKRKKDRACCGQRFPLITTADPTDAHYCPRKRA